MNNTIADLVGDVPVSEQIAAALEHMAPKDHTHNDCATRLEVEELRAKIEVLTALVGDIRVSDQIATALKHIK